MTKKIQNYCLINSIKKPKLKKYKPYFHPLEIYNINNKYNTKKH